MSWESFWTPALVPTLGGCQTDCNRCGQVCPSGAIPNLPLEEKKKQMIGLAVVDEIDLHQLHGLRAGLPDEGDQPGRDPQGGREADAEAASGRGGDKCNGCGQCEFVCPAPPSIKVWTLAGAPKGGKMLERV